MVVVLLHISDGWEAFLWLSKRNVSIVRIDIFVESCSWHHGSTSMPATACQRFTTAVPLGVKRPSIGMFRVSLT